MSGTVLDRSATGILVLIIPIAFILVVLYTAWPLILAIVVGAIALKIWQQYQWQKWSQQVNPFFNQLLKDNQGCVTPLDLSVRANLSATAAKRYLDKKSEEYGAQRKTHQSQGATVYYFLTASALGSVFDSSDPAWEVEGEEARSPAAPSEPENARESGHLATATVPSTLIQTELAKRLQVKDYKISRRKSDPNFAQWTQHLDPDGIAWAYSPQDKLFVAQTN